MTTKPPSKPPTGYGNPPEKSRWQPGQSGNPSGRPKGAKSIKGRMQDHLNKVVTVNENGKRVRMTVLDLLFRGIVSSGAKGNAPAAKEAFRLIKDFNLNIEPPVAAFDSSDEVLVGLIYGAQRILDRRGKSALYAKPTTEEERRALDKMIEAGVRQSIRRR